MFLPTLSHLPSRQLFITIVIIATTTTTTTTTATATATITMTTTILRDLNTVTQKNYPTKRS